jgi:hypothetical protein
MRNEIPRQDIGCWDLAVLIHIEDDISYPVNTLVAVKHYLKIRESRGDKTAAHKSRRQANSLIPYIVMF